MSSTASSYDLQRLQVGISLIVLAVISSLVVSSAMLLEARGTGLWASSILILHGCMMFASSFVEEEHHFWYWASSGWLTWLFSKQ